MTVLVAVLVEMVDLASAVAWARGSLNEIEMLKTLTTTAQEYTDLHSPLPHVQIKTICEVIFFCNFRGIPKMFRKIFYRVATITSMFANVISLTDCFENFFGLDYVWFG